MKRLISLLLITFIAASSAACSQKAEPPEAPTSTQAQAQDTANEATTPSPPPAPEPNPEPPAPEAFVPEDIFGSEFNPYHDVDFPGNFRVYGASFDIGVEKLGGKPHYIISMTAEGSTDETIAFLAKLAGIDDTEFVAQEAKGFKSHAFSEFFSTNGAETFTVRATNPDDDRYEYVEGCHIDITLNLSAEQAPRYIQLLRDNFNTNALAVAADNFDTTPVFGKCYIAVNLHKKWSRVEMSYPVSDVSAIQTSMVENVKSDWYDAQNGKMGLSYGMLGVEVIFDVTGNTIYVIEQTSETKSALAAYVEPEVSLVKLGFGFDQENICGVYAQHEPHYMNVAIHKPEWGEFNEDWNIEYLDQVNGYGLRITYYVAEDKYHFSADKGNLVAAFDYFPTKNEYTGEYPDFDTVKQIYNDAFGTQDKDFYDKPLAYFEQLVKERFGLSIKELYKLPIR